MIPGAIAYLILHRAPPEQPEDQDSPAAQPGIPVRYLRRFHAWMTAVWLILLAPSLLWWSHSILWVILLSVWANIASHFGAWQGARAEATAGGTQ